MLLGLSGMDLSSRGYERGQAGSAFFCVLVARRKPKYRPCERIEMAQNTDREIHSPEGRLAVAIVPDDDAAAMRR